MIAQEVIDPKDWDSFTPEQRQAYRSVSEFGTEQEADKFVEAQVEAANAANPQLPRKQSY
jgi:hypothetical protein